MRFTIVTHQAYDTTPILTVVDWPEIQDLPTARLRAREVLESRNAKLGIGARQWLLGLVEFHDASPDDAFGEGYAASRAGYDLELHCPYAGAEFPSLTEHEAMWKRGFQAHKHDLNRRRQRKVETTA